MSDFSPSETEVFIDTDEIFANADHTGMIITYTDECPVETLGKYLELARTKGFDMQEQWFDTQLKRNVLCFGDVK
jgi:hypothetical protein